MRRHLAASIALIVLAIPGAAAQTQVRDTQAERPRARGTGVIAGTVVSFENGRPVRFAAVTLVGGGATEGELRAATDDAGGFSFGDLPPGTYWLSVSKAGFLDARYGQTRPGTSSPKERL